MDGFQQVRIWKLLIRSEVSVSPVRIVLSFKVTAFESKESLFWRDGLGGMTEIIAVLVGCLVSWDEAFCSDSS